MVDLKTKTGETDERKKYFQNLGFSQESDKRRTSSNQQSSRGKSIIIETDKIRFD